MAEFIQQSVEAKIKFDEDIDLVKLEEITLSGCKAFCDRERGVSESCEATSQADTEAQTLALRCGSIICSQLNVGERHPILDTLAGLAHNSESTTRFTLERIY